MDFAETFQHGLTYQGFLDAYATDEQRRRWTAFRECVQLNSGQQALLSGFSRQMNVMVLAGAWCGDCVNQCPIFDHFATANERIVVRYFDRDDHPELAAELSVCGGQRVPAVLFLSEDYLPCGRYGDRTLTKYRQMAQELLGESCSTGLVPRDQLTDGVLQEWLDQFERAQLILCTSGRLRKLHGD